MMNICLITGIFPPDIGGPATYVSRLAESLCREHHKICVITLGNETSEHPFPVKRVSRSLPVFFRLPLLCVLLLLYGWKSQIWYINGLELPSVLVGKLLRKRLVMKIVGDYAWERAMNRDVTSDSIDDFQQKTQSSRQVNIHKTLRAWLARQVDTIVTPSRYLKQLVGGWGVPAENIHVIYNAVEGLQRPLRPRREIRKELNIAECDQLLVTVGRLVRWKGIDSLIRALAQFDSSVKLLIVGDGPEKNKLTELTRAFNLTRRVKFLGKSGRNQVLDYIHASDLFVLNTGYEGFSHVLLEAMMVGCPVLTTAVCGNPELVTHHENGIFIQVDSPEELQEQMQQVLADGSLRQSCIEQGKQTVRHYSWKRLLEQTAACLTGT
ncbi:MAG: glycosyltransferase family 4 protein [bacterium]|nr:glycosyltransferase family 4 protein [bacterium]